MEGLRTKCPRYPLLLDVTFFDHSVVNSHLFFPIPVEDILCACEREVGTRKVRPTSDPLGKSKTNLNGNLLARR